MNIEENIKAFRSEITRDYLINDNNIIYLRLSALDNSLDVNKRIDDAMNKLTSDFNKIIETYPALNESGFKLYVEIKSAYKNSTREVFNQICEKELFKDFKITEILNPQIPSETLNLYVSSFDRMSRVFLYSLPIQILRLFRNIRIYSLIDEERLIEEEAKDILNKSNNDQLMFIFKIMLNSSKAEKHSEDMSNKIVKRVVKTKKGTYSSKTGAKWGREKTISDSMVKRIKELKKSFTAQEISDMSNVYQIVKGKKKPISVNTIYSIVKE